MSVSLPRRLLCAWLAVTLAGTGLVTTSTAQAPAAPSLAGRLLVAAPDMRDPRFVESVIYMVRHDAEGAMGVVVNRPLRPLPLAQLLESSGQSVEGVQGSLLAHWGGPVEGGKGLVLHTPDYRIDTTVVVRERIALTANRKILEAIATSAGPRRSLFVLGYAGWTAGQLEGELARGSWVTASADEDLLFDADYPTKWRRATARRLLDL